MFGHIQLVIVYNIHHINGLCDHKLLLNSEERNPEGGEDIKTAKCHCSSLCSRLLRWGSLFVTLLETSNATECLHLQILAKA